MEQFKEILNQNKLKLVRKKPEILQINTGLLCNQKCRHCHIDAGPDKKEYLMNRDIMDEIIRFASDNEFSIIDITGGAPEMNPDLPYLIESVSDLAEEVILRSNLTAINGNRYTQLIEQLKEKSVTITASFPSLNELQTDSQRGNGVYSRSIETLKKLNNEGFGIKGSDLVLNLVSNPAGAYMPQNQCNMEKRFREVLFKKWGINFSSLFSFTNVPLGRFRKWLMETGNYDMYIGKLEKQFNPEAIENVMCRNLISISWDGYLFDCDFNHAARIYAGGKKRHISEVVKPPEVGNEIAVSDHCFACTAGSGFT